MKNLHQTNGQNSQPALNGSIKLTYININTKFKWTKCPNQIQTGELNKKSKRNRYAASRPISHTRIHKDSKQMDGGRFTNQMESKKKLELQFSSMIK